MKVDLREIERLVDESWTELSLEFHGIDADSEARARLREKLYANAPDIVAELRASREAHDRLSTIIFERFTEPGSESTEELLTTLERALHEDRMRHLAALTRAEKAEAELVAERGRTQEAIDAIRKLGRDGAFDSILPGTYGAEITGDD